MLDDSDREWFRSLCTEVMEAIKAEQTRPSVLFKPIVTIPGFVSGSKGPRYICELAGGIHAYGNTPDEATRNFDKAWYE